MKITKTFENATLRTVNNGYIELDYNDNTDCFYNASVISVNNGVITIEVDWEPKEGELVKITGNCIDAYSIFRSHDKSADTIVVYGYKRINRDNHEFGRSYWSPGSQTEIHPVTPAEQQAFDDFCKSQGKIWNKEKLQWEKYRWKPITGEWYYFVDHSYPDAVSRHRWAIDTIDNRYYDNYNCFQTKEEALEAVKKLKEFFKSL
jgi:hypothetical protein